MFTSAVNLVLVTGLLAISAYLIPARYELARLKRELADLEHRVGNAYLKHPEKCFVRLVKPGPTQFAWRVHMPATKQLHMLFGVHNLRTARWNTVTSGKVLPQNTLVQLTIEERDGKRRAHLSTLGFFNNSGLGHLEEFIWEHLSECEISTAGTNDGTYFDTNEMITLLSIRASPELIRRSQGDLRDFQIKQLSNTLVLVLASPRAVADLQGQTK